jgi:NCAIR mutase (PurE)-related protein
MYLDSNEPAILKLLQSVAAGELSADAAFGRLRQLDPLGTDEYEDLDFAKIDHSRARRNGFPEVIFCEGKTPDQVARIATSILDRGANLLATRADLAHFQAIQEVVPDADYAPRGRVITAVRQPQDLRGIVAVVSAGTADQPVAEEAAITAEALGTHVERYSDVGVAGLHRLLACIEKIRRADVIIAVAGMEGALVSVLGGLVDKPVLAVPSGVGYGANFGGVTTLLAMINSCASGVAVLNIGNGFGAGYLAATICRQIYRQPAREASAESQAADPDSKPIDYKEETP